jgi:peptide methionine sulfoxide reductase msrA/msrB
MNRVLMFGLFISLIILSMSAQNKKFNPLTPEETRVLVNKGTERPFTGMYYDFYEKGTYICKRCDAPLYHSTTKFDSGCGWPSFDDEVKGAVKRVPDADGRRTEIVCANCDAHLGHVFKGEGFTAKNTRHCVNSVSLNFIPDKKKEMKTEKAILASGCFWGVEYHLQKIPGVIETSVGYTGGHKDKPTYKEVCTGTTGHAEAVEVVFDPEKVSFETICKVFFETHDPTQVDGQGPDIGDQYRSEIFYVNDNQKVVSEKLIGILRDKGYNVVTKLTPATTFWIAEDYHQDYYDHKGSTPYCHIYKKKF